MVLLALLIASTGPPMSRWEYSSERLPQTCPSSDTMQHMVSARLGRVPFDGQSATSTRVQIAEVASGFEATIEFETPPQKPQTRSISAATCESLAETIALMVALSLDSVTLPERRPAATPPPPPPSPTPTDPTPPPRPELWISADAALGFASTFAGGGRLGTAIRFSNKIGIGLEARVQTSALVQTSFGSYSLLSGAGALLGCYSIGVVSVCIEGGAGALGIISERLQPERSVAVSSFAGLRVGGTWWFADTMGARLELEGLLPFGRVAIVAAEQTLWVRSPIVGGLVVSFTWRGKAQEVAVTSRPLMPQ